MAIKILADNHSLDPELRGRFIDEAWALRKIDSPSVVAIRDVFETPDARPYLVLQLADRGNIVDRRRQLVSNGWVPEVHDVRRIVELMGSALQAVHGAGLVHRDVTPSNVLIRSDPEAADSEGPTATSGSFLQQDERLILSDFGLVKDLAAGSGLTRGAGTVGFASPEQQLPLGTVDCRADVFGASAVVLWMITGEGTQPGVDSTVGVDQRWPASLRRALRRGLSTDPGDRQPDVAAWHRDVTLSLQEASPARSGRRRVLVVAAFAAAAVVATVAALALFPAEAGESPGIVTETAEPLAPAQVSSSAPVSQEQVLVPGPLPRGLSRVSSGNNARLVVAWGGDPIPPQVVESEIQVAVDDGSWVTEQDPDRASAGGWEIWSTSDASGESLAVAWASAYAVRVRWLFIDGSFSDWSESQVLLPEEEPTRESRPEVVSPPDNQALSFVADGEGVRLALGFGVGSAGSVHAVTTEVSLRVDGGDWFTEPELETIVAADLLIWSTGPADARQRVINDRSYQTRIRWKLADGSFTDWSQALSLDAGSPAE